MEPVPDMLDMFLGRDDVPQEIMHYYKYYKIKKFKFDRPFNRGEKDKNNELKVCKPCPCIFVLLNEGFLIICVL